MGYRDYKLMLCDSQTVTDEVSDYYVDTELTYPAWEKGTPMAVVVTVETAATGTTGFEIAIVHNEAGAPTLGDTTLLLMYIPVANLTKGTEIVIPFPQGVPIKRYVGIDFGDTSADESMVCSAYITPYPISRQ
jgi:hypothetical protein